MNDPLRPTREGGPYVFVCYSHENVEEIFWYLSQLSDRGIRVWFDEGISPGESWSQEIADAIVGALKVDDRGFIPEFSVFATNPF